MEDSEHLEDLEFISKYPFVAKAKEYVAKNFPSINLQILNKGKERIKQALGGEIKEFVELDSKSFENYLLSYAASRLILGAWRNTYARQRLAVAESKIAKKYLDKEKKENILKLAKEFGFEFFESDLSDYYFIDVFSFLNYAPKDPKYKLVYFELHKGKLKVSKEQLIRILEEAIRTRLEQVIELPTYPKEVEGIINELKELIPKQNIEQIKINTSDFPPCIKKLIDQLSSSINVPHIGRVCLTIYLIKAGLTNEQIIKLFSFAPDFKEDITTYQIEFIRKKNYNMPSCNTMESNGLCIATCNCFNPLKFRKKFHGKNAKNSILKEDEKYAADY
jgi:DNA primase large subunit